MNGGITPNNMKKVFNFILALTAVIPSFSNPVLANSADVQAPNEIEAYANELGNLTDRFLFYNGRYYGKSEASNGQDKNYVEYLKNASNLQLKDSWQRFYSGTAVGRCCGMSILSILAHNGVFSPSDIQEGKERLIDIECNTKSFLLASEDPVMNKIISYQLRQDKMDFNLFMKWNFSHYSQAELVDYALETAKKADENGKYFFLTYYDSNLWHTVTGMGIMDGEWEWYGKKYDKCILTIDTNILHEVEETGDVISYGCNDDACLFVNSETRDVCLPFYFDPEQAPSMICGGEDFKVFTFDDDDFMNYMGKINPSYSYDTKISDAISDIASISVNTENECAINVTDSENNTYDGKAECDVIFPNNGNEYVLKGKDFEVQNIDNAENFGVNFADINHGVYTNFQGAVNNISYNSDEFNFDVSAPTSYDISMIFEEGSYEFSPHYRFDFSGNANTDFKAVQTDRGVILSSSDGLECQVKVNDIIRDENGLVSVVYEDNDTNKRAFPEEKVQEEAISTLNNVLLTFDENGSLKYYIGENYDTEVEKGDVNCDGLIDAVDATQILIAYSKNSTDSTAYVGKTLGDYNGDGFVDSVDSTQVLMKYAELSTK